MSSDSQGKVFAGFGHWEYSRFGLFLFDFWRIYLSLRLLNTIREIAIVRLSRSSLSCLHGPNFYYSMNNLVQECDHASRNSVYFLPATSKSMLLWDRPDSFQKLWIEVLGPNGPVRRGKNILSRLRRSNCSDYISK